jgi:subtilisin family serine protease
MSPHHPYHARHRGVDHLRLSRWMTMILLLSLLMAFAFQPTLVSAERPTKSTPIATAMPSANETAPVESLVDGSMRLVTESTGARAYWEAGFAGKGVDIAIIDSGIAPVDGLSAPGKVIFGPDLSFESQDEATRYLDTNGHGTHLAGIVAGRDAAASGDYSADVSNFLGMAPDARVISLKVADSHGRNDVSQVIAAIDWVVQHKNDAGLNIRVLLIAYGTDSQAGWQHDPLVFAAEQAWQQVFSWSSPRATTDRPPSRLRL